MKHASKLTLFVLLLIVSVVAFSACAPMKRNVPVVEAATEENPTSLAGTRWNLVGLGQPGALTPPLPETQITLDIDAEWMSGSASCNTYSYNYTVEGQALKFTAPGIRTLMACMDPLMQQEDAFLKLMDAVSGYTLEGDRLTLTGAEGMLIFEVAAALPLEGTAWTLTGIAQDDAVVSTNVDTQITLRFENGQVNGFAGCNTYFGPYTREENTLTFGALASTRMACEGEPGQRETEFLAALQRVAGFRIERGQLALLDAKSNLLLSLVASTAP